MATKGPHRVLLGDYLNSLEKRFPPGGCTAYWQLTFARECLHRLEGEAILDYKLEEPEWLQPAPHNFTWIAERINYSPDEIHERITQCLEFIFLGGPRKRLIDIVQLAEVTKWTVMYIRGEQPISILGLQPEKEGTMNSQTDELVVRESDLNSDQFIARIKEAVIAKEPIKICTPQDTMVDFLCNDAIASGNIFYEQKKAVGQIDSIAEWICEHQGFGIVMCDIGIAYQVFNYLQQVKSLMEEGKYQYRTDRLSQRVPKWYKDYRKESKHPQLECCSIYYRRPVPVGIAYRLDDPWWADISKKALKSVLQSEDTHVQKSLVKTKEIVARLGMQWVGMK